MPGIARVHGGVSQSYSKKSYGITLDAPISLLGMRKSAHWLLNAAYIDRSLMRHKLSYDLFRSLSSPNAPRFAVASRFVEVHLNGKYNGVYLLMERLDGQLLGLRPLNSNDVARKTARGWRSIAWHHSCAAAIRLEDPRPPQQVLDALSLHYALERAIPRELALVRHYSV